MSLGDVIHIFGILFVGEDNQSRYASLRSYLFLSEQMWCMFVSLFGNLMTRKRNSWEERGRRKDNWLSGVEGVRNGIAHATVLIFDGLCKVV